MELGLVSLVGSAIGFSAGFITESLVKVPTLTWFSDRGAARAIASAKVLGSRPNTVFWICMGKPPIYFSIPRESGVTRCGTNKLNS